MKIIIEAKIILLFILSLAILPVRGGDTINCNRTFDKVPKPFSFGQYYGSESGTLWKASGSGEIAVLLSDKKSQVLKLKTSADFNAILFMDFQFGFVLGTDGTIFGTSDSGQSWVEQKSNTGEELFAISCVNKYTCWAVGKNGVLVSTKNGGEDWELSVVEKNKTLFAVDFISETVGWVAGKGGLIMKTEDGGKTWREASNLGSSGQKTFKIGSTDWNAVNFFNENFGCVAGDNRIICTQDGGKNWNETLVDDSKERFYFVGFSILNDKPIALEQCGKDFQSDSLGKNWIRR
jgi:photosystem II stability/assembly factor-like uncharacterized protein